MQTLTNKLEKLSIQMQEIQKSMRQRRSSFTNQPITGNHWQRHRSSSQRRREYRDAICWYHKRFGHQAHKCQEPCKFYDDFLSSKITQQSGNGRHGSK